MQSPCMETYLVYLFLLLMPGTISFSIYRKFNQSDIVDKYTLVVRREVLPGHKRPQLTVNGTTPGPTLTTTLGNSLEVTVLNEVYDDAISIHWHGMSMRGTPQMDGVVNVTQCPISNVPGNNTFVYSFRPDLPGTYWYHGHMHSHYPDGLYGVFVVQDLWEREQWSSRFNLSYHMDGASPIDAKYIFNADDEGCESSQGWDTQRKDTGKVGSCSHRNNPNAGGVGKFTYGCEMTTVPSSVDASDRTGVVGDEDGCGASSLPCTLPASLVSRPPPQGGSGWGVLQVADYFLSEARHLEEAFVKPGSFALDPVPDAIIVNNLFSMPRTPLLPALVLSTPPDPPLSSENRPIFPLSARLRLLNAAAYSPYTFSLHLGAPPSADSASSAPPISSLSPPLPFYVLELDGPPIVPLLTTNITLYPAQRASVLLDFALLLQGTGEASGWRTLYVTFTLQPQIYPTYDPHSPPQHNMFGSTSHEPLEFRWTAPWFIYLPCGTPAPFPIGRPMQTTWDVNLMNAAPLYTPPSPPPAPRVRINIRTSFYLDSDGVVRAYVNEGTMGETQGITPFPPSPPSLYSLLGEGAPTMGEVHKSSLYYSYLIHNHTSTFHHHSPVSLKALPRPQAAPLPFWLTSLPLIEGSGSQPFILPPSSSIPYIEKGSIETGEVVGGSEDAGYMVEVLVDGHCCGAHPFHLHGHHMLLVASNELPEGRDGPFTPTGADNRNRRLGDEGGGDTADSITPYPPYPKDGYLPRDVVTVPFGGWALVRIWRANDGVGVWPFHCHLHWHMSIGLSAMIIEQPEDWTDSGVHISLYHLRMCEADTAKIYREGEWGVDDNVISTQSPSEFPSGFPTSASFPTFISSAEPTSSHPTLIPSPFSPLVSSSSPYLLSGVPTLISPSPLEDEPTPLLPSLHPSALLSWPPSQVPESSLSPTSLPSALSYFPSVSPSAAVTSLVSNPNTLPYPSALSAPATTSLLPSLSPSVLPTIFLQPESDPSSFPSTVESPMSFSAAPSLSIYTLPPSKSPFVSSLSPLQTYAPSLLPSFSPSLASAPSVPVDSSGSPGPSVASTQLPTYSSFLPTCPSLSPSSFPPLSLSPQLSPQPSSTPTTVVMPSVSSHSVGPTNSIGSLELHYTVDVYLVLPLAFPQSVLMSLLRDGVVYSLRRNIEGIIANDDIRLTFARVLPRTFSSQQKGFGWIVYGSVDEGEDWNFTVTVEFAYTGLVPTPILLSECALALRLGVENSEIWKSLLDVLSENDIYPGSGSGVSGAMVDVFRSDRVPKHEKNPSSWGSATLMTLAVVLCGGLLASLAFCGLLYSFCGFRFCPDKSCVNVRSQGDSRILWGWYVQELEASFDGAREDKEIDNIHSDNCSPTKYQSQPIFPSHTDSPQRGSAPLAIWDDDL